MRLLGIIVVLASLAWGGWWYFGATALERSTENWLEQRRAEGWQAEAGVDVRGFPNRFDLTLSDIELADPQSGLSWRAPFFQLLALSYKPNHLIAVWPREQQLSTPYEAMTLTNDDMRASLVVDAESRAALDRTTLTAEAVDLSSDLGWQMRLEQLSLAAERVDKGANRYHLGLEARGLRPGGDLLGQLDPSATLPELLEVLRLDSTVSFDAPWNLDALERRRPQPMAVQLDELRATWGDMQFRLSGALDIDAQGFPEGQLKLEAQNWQRMLKISVNAGALPEAFAGTVESVLGMIAGGSDTLDAAIVFREGRMFYGPIPLGPAPMLVLR